MTEPLDLDAIEAEARAYVEAYGKRYGGATGQAFDYLRQMLAVLDARDAEIERRRLLANADHEKIASLAARLRDLRAPPGADVLVEEGRQFDHSLETQLARFEEAVNYYEPSAPPGADATQIAARVWYTEIDGKPQSPGWTITAYARALQQYGDDRAAAATEAERRRCATIDHIDIDIIRREAREAAIEEAAQLCKHHAGVAGSMTEARDMGNFLADAIRALAAKPGSKT